MLNTKPVPGAKVAEIQRRRNDRLRVRRAWVGGCTLLCPGCVPSFGYSHIHAFSWFFHFHFDTFSNGWRNSVAASLTPNIKMVRNYEYLF